MKLKSLLFGSAAALVAVTGAQAADMPIAEPVEYVRICDAFGTGFFYIPGTDTCLKISGYVRVEAYWQADVEDTADARLDWEDIFHPADETSETLGIVLDSIAFTNRSDDNFTTFARGALQMDARRMTDIGLLRVAFQYFMNVNAEFDASENNGDGTALDFAFIQLSNDLGTLTVGHTGSFFNFKGSGTLEGTGANDANTTLIGYSFNVGNGVSFSLALEDSNSGGRNGGIEVGKALWDDDDDTQDCDNDFSTFGAYEVAESFASDSEASFCFADHDGDEIPDITANIRLDQAWGSIQLMGALHHVRGNAAVVTLSTQDIDLGDLSTAIAIDTDETGYHHEEEWGWAVGAGAELTGGIFSAFIQGFYGEGIGNYFWSPVSGASVPEGVFGESGSMSTPTVWFVNGAVTAGLGASLTAVLAASYGDYDGPSLGGLSTPDYDEWALAGDLLWSPTGGMTIGVGVVHWDNSVLGDGTKGRVRFQSSF